MTTPILEIPEVAQGQVNQYLTINEAIRILEASVNANLAVDLTSGDATVTNLTPDFEMLRYGVFIAQNNTVSRTITFSANQRVFIVNNAGTFDLNVTIGSTTVVVPVGETYRFFADGTADGLIRAQ